MTDEHTPSDQDRALVSVTGSSDNHAVPVISLRGELDLGCVERARAGIEPFLTPDTERVVFDLGALKFMDSSGIALLVEVANRVPAVEVRDPTPIVRRVLEVTGLAESFGLIP
jgi:anti-sigma B factor antagonist